MRLSLTLRPGRLTVAALLLFLTSHRHAHGSILRTDTNQVVVAHSPPLLAEKNPATSVVPNYDAHLIELTLDAGCQFALPGFPLSVLPIPEDKQTRLAALVHLTPACPTVLQVLLANRGPTNGIAYDIRNAVNTLVFASKFNAPDADIGGTVENIFQYYLEGIPLYNMDILVVGADGGRTLSAVAGEANATAGLPVRIAYEASPWDAYYNSASWLGPCWTFFALHLLATAYLAYRAIRLMHIHGYDFRGPFLARHIVTVLLLLHFTLLMICPIESAFTRLSSCANKLGMALEGFAYFVLIVEWARVSYRRYHWRYLYYFNFLTLTTLALLALSACLAAAQVYHYTSEGLNTLSRGLRWYVGPTLILVQICVLVYSGISIAAVQRRASHSEEDSLALFKPTILCLLSCFGFAVTFLTDTIRTAIWSQPLIVIFIASTACQQVFSLATAAAIMWTFSEAYKVCDHRSAGDGQSPQASPRKKSRPSGPQLPLATVVTEKGEISRPYPLSTYLPHIQVDVNLELSACYADLFINQVGRGPHHDSSITSSDTFASHDLAGFFTRKFSILQQRGPPESAPCKG